MWEPVTELFYVIKSQTSHKSPLISSHSMGQPLPQAYPFTKNHHQKACKKSLNLEKSSLSKGKGNDLIKARILGYLLIYLDRDELRDILAGDILSFSGNGDGNGNGSDGFNLGEGGLEMAEGFMEFLIRACECVTLTFLELRYLHSPL